MKLKLLVLFCVIIFLVESKTVAEVKQCNKDCLRRYKPTYNNKKDLNSALDYNKCLKEEPYYNDYRSAYIYGNKNDTYTKEMSD